MRAPSRLTFLAWALVFAGGCAAVTGLNGISESDCEPNCGDAEAKTDVTTDSPVAETQPPVDHSSPETGNQPESSVPETGGPQDAQTTESGKEGGGTEAGVNEGGVDAPPDVSYDAPFDSGCGDLNTTSHCSACPDTCAPTSASVTSASCTGPTNGQGATCQYSCATGYLDCNAALNPPDLDGCECHSPGATLTNCGSGVGGTPGCCPVQHTDGLSGGSYPPPTFYDCVASATYTANLATDACVNWTGNQADCGSAGQCTDSADAGTGDFVVCGAINGTGACACWEYQGPNNGKVTVATGTLLGNCICPGSTGAGISTFSYN